MRKYIAVSLIIASFVSVSYAKTLAQIRNDIRYKIGDSTATVTTVKWSDAELNARINDVQRNVTQFTRCIYTSSATTPTAGVREYLMPPNCISIDRVSFLQTSSTASYKKLDSVTMGGLDVQFPGGWENNVAGKPLYYYERGEYIGFERPVSSTYVSTDAIKVDYFKYPDDMTSDTSTPYDGLAYLQLYSDVLVYGVIAACKEDENKNNLDAANKYELRINLMISSLKTKSDQSVQQIKMGK